MRDLITIDPTIMRGKPVVSGTRITVEHILEQLGHGHSVEELLAGHLLAHENLHQLVVARLVVRILASEGENLQQAFSVLTPTRLRIRS